MDDSSSIPPSNGGPIDSTSTHLNTRTRGPIKLKGVAAKHRSGQKLEVVFDELGRPIGEHAKVFSSYVGMLARTKVSILPLEWHDVARDVKDMIWQDLSETFTIPNNELLKKKLLSYACERWKAFKNTLTKEYVFGSKCSPCEKYYSISDEVWQRIVEIRQEPEFQAKRKKGIENQSKNKYPHSLSRGGYKLLKEKMTQASGDGEASIVDPPRHEMWKQARIKRSGEYTSEASALVAEKINSLVEQSTQGSFVPHGRQDILTAAIGTPEHPGRAHTAGRGVGLRNNFGPHSRCGTTSGSIHTDQLEEVINKKVQQEVEKKWQEEMEQRMEKMLQEKMALVVASMSSQQPIDVQLPSSPIVTMHASTKGSCAAAASTDGPKLPASKELALKLHGFDGHAVLVQLEHEDVPCYFVRTHDILISLAKKYGFQ